MAILDRDDDQVKLGVDNQSALALIKNSVFNVRSKHIRIHYHYIRQCMEEGSISGKFVATHDQLADILTKALGRVKFQELHTRIGMALINPKACAQGLEGD